MKTKVICSFLLSFLFVGLSYAQVTHVTGDRYCMLPPAEATAICPWFTAFPDNLSSYEWRLSKYASQEYVGADMIERNRAWFMIRVAGEYLVECRSTSGYWQRFTFFILPYKYKSINYNASIEKIMIEPENSEGITTTDYYQITNLRTSQVLDKGYVDNRTESIDVSKLPKGMYVFNLISNDNGKTSYKFTVK